MGTERNPTKSAPFKHVEDAWDCKDGDKPFWTAKDGTEGHGSYVYKDGEIVGLSFVCPGCLDLTTIMFKRFGVHATWNWDGNVESPTCTPSILHHASNTPDRCGWHGYLTAGVFKSC